MCVIYNNYRDFPEVKSHIFRDERVTPDLHTVHRRAVRLVASPNSNCRYDSTSVYIDSN